MMTIRQALPCGIAAALMLAAAFPAWAAEKPARKDALTGTWTSKLEGIPMILTFSAGKFSATVVNKQLMSGTYRVDATKLPEQLDLAITEGDAKVVGKSVLCIFEVKDRKLKWCANDPAKGNPRAKRFPEAQGERGNYVYLVFDRVKTPESVQGADNSHGNGTLFPLTDNPEIARIHATAYIVGEALRAGIVQRRPGGVNPVDATSGLVSRVYRALRGK